MNHLASVVLQLPQVFDSNAVGQRINGGALATGNLLTGLARHQRVTGLEIFTSAEVITNPALLETTAHRILPPQLRGQNRVRFYPIHSLPDIWADNQPRVHYCPTPESMAQVRYLRDRFAIGPQPIACDTHSYGQWSQTYALAHYAQGSPVAFDSIVSLSEACCETTKRIIRDLSGRANGPLTARMDVIPRGIDPEQFHKVDEAAKQEFRTQLGLPAYATVTLYLGRVTPYAKADLLPLLRVFAKVSSKSNEYLLIAGEADPASYSNLLVDLATELGIAERVIVHGRVSPGDRLKYYSAADIFVFPSDSIIETFGSTVIEAMACGLPCIVSDWDGLRDTVVEGETGFKIATSWIPCHDKLSALSPVVDNTTESLYIGQTVLIDQTAFGNALQTLLGDPALRRTMGDAGAARVLTHYTWSRVIDLWIALWDELTDLASRESTEDKAIRKAQAEHLGLPNRYVEHYSNFASRVLDPARVLVSLTERGRNCLTSQRQINFYEACRPLIKSKVMAAIAQILTDSGDNATRMQDLTSMVARVAPCPEDEIRFHIVLLAKRDIVELK